MTMSFNRFVATEAFSVAALNAGINASYTWWLWRTPDVLTFRGEGAIAFDLASTPVWIAMLSTLFGTASARRKLREGRVSSSEVQLASLLRVLPQGTPSRATALAIAAAALLSLPLWAILQIVAPEVLSLGAAVLTKVGITVLMSLVIVPLVILAALGDVGREDRTENGHPRILGQDFAL